MTRAYRPTYGSSVWQGYGQDDEGLPEQVADDAAAQTPVGPDEGSTATDTPTAGGAAAPAPTPATTINGKQYVPKAQYDAALAETKKWKTRFWVMFGVGVATTVGAGVGGYFVGKAVVRSSLGGLDDGMADLGDTDGPPLLPPHARS